MGNRSFQLPTPQTYNLMAQAPHLSGFRNSHLRPVDLVIPVVIVAWTSPLTYFWNRDSAKTNATIILLSQLRPKGSQGQFIHTLTEVGFQRST